jgi:hypothetical protein
MLSCYGGISINSHPEFFDHFWNTGINFGINGGYHFTNAFAIRYSMSYNYFPLNMPRYLSETGAEAAGFSGSGGANRFITFSAEGLYALRIGSSPLKPYIVAGLGGMHYSRDPIVLEKPGSKFEIKWYSELAFLIQAGGGMEINLGSSFGIYLESIYTYCFTPDVHTSYIPLRIGFTSYL